MVEVLPVTHVLTFLGSIRDFCSSCGGRRRPTVVFPVVGVDGRLLLPLSLLLVQPLHQHGSRDDLPLVLLDGSAVEGQLLAGPVLPIEGGRLVLCIVRNGQSLKILYFAPLNMSKSGV